MADKIKTVADDMDSRAILPTKEAAANYLARCMAEYSDFGNFDIVTPIDLARGVSGLGQDEEGNLVFDAEIYPDDMQIMIAVLTQRGEGEKAASTVKAITISPVPTFDAILADDAGKKWLEKIVATELNRNAVRLLRPKDADVADQQILAALPRTLADYVTSNRGGASAVFEAFEEYWKVIKQGLGKMSKAWKLANLNKKEFKNAMSSKAYASQYYPTLEEAKAGSLFVLALQAFSKFANDAGMDASIFDQWIATRDAYVISDDDDNEDEEEISFDLLTASIASGQGEEATEEAEEQEDEAGDETAGTDEEANT